MPAVKSFALYAAFAVLMDFVLQMSAFVALLSLDTRRQDSNRCEIACCVTVKQPRSSKPNEGILLPLMQKYYAPALLHPVSRIVVVRPLHWCINTLQLKNKSSFGWQNIRILKLFQCKRIILNYIVRYYSMCRFTCSNLFHHADRGVPLLLLCLHLPDVQCEGGLGSGAGYAISKCQLIRHN